MEEFAVALGSHKFSIAYGNLPANGDHGGTAFHGPAFEGAVIDSHELVFCGENAAIIGVVDNQVGIAAKLDGAFAGEEIKGLRGLGAGDIDESVKIN